jgi:sugar phosphate isomerase/epimerase
VSGIEYQEQYAISTWQYVSRSLDEALTRIAESGFKWVELWGDSVHVDPRINPDVKAIQSQLQRLGLRVHSIHLPFSDLDLGHPNSGLKHDWLRVTGDALRLCDELGGRLAVVHVSSHHMDLTDDRLYQASCDIIAEFVQELNLQAKELGIQLALENLPALGQRRPSNSLQALSKLCTNPEIGFCLDIGHAAVNGFAQRDEIQAAGARMLSLHVSNNDGYEDLHWLPNVGVIDWQGVKEELARISYNQAYVLEVNGFDDPDAVMRQVVEFVRADSER